MEEIIKRCKRCGTIIHTDEALCSHCKNVSENLKKGDQRWKNKPIRIKKDTKKRSRRADIHSKRPGTYTVSQG